MLGKSRTLHISYALMAFLATSSSVIIAMDLREEVNLRKTHPGQLRDHDYYQNELKKLEASTRRIHEEVDRILGELKWNREAYYRLTRGSQAPGKTEAPAKPQQPPAASHTSMPQKSQEEIKPPKEEQNPKKAETKDHQVQLPPEVVLYTNAISWKKREVGEKPIIIKINAEDVVNAVQKSPGKYYGHAGLNLIQYFQTEFLASLSGKEVINEIINRLNNQFIPDDKFNLSACLAKMGGLEWKKWCIGFYVSWLFDQMNEKKRIEEKHKAAEEEKRRKEAEAKERREQERRRQEERRVASEQARKQQQERKEAEEKKRQEREREEEVLRQSAAKEAEQLRLEKEQKEILENLQRQQEEQHRKQQEEQKRIKEEADKQEKQQQTVQQPVANVMKFGGMDINWIKAQPQYGSLWISVPFSAENVIEYVKNSSDYSRKFLTSPEGKKLISGIINRLNGKLIPQDDSISSLDKNYTRAMPGVPNMANTDSNKKLIAQYADELYKKSQPAKPQLSEAEMKMQKQQDDELKQQLIDRKEQAETKAVQEKNKRSAAAAAKPNRQQYYYLEALKLLGINATGTTTQQEVTQAFRTQALLFHSDKTSSPEDEVRFKTLKDAQDYAVAYLNGAQTFKKASEALQLLRSEAQRNLAIKVPQSLSSGGNITHLCNQMIELLERQAMMNANPSQQFLEKNTELKTAYEAILTYDKAQRLLYAGW